MKRKILVFVLVMGLAVGTASAQLGSGIVYDPTNYHNALLRYYQLQQHLLQLQKSYAKITSQLNLAMQMATFVRNMPARYRAVFSQWRNVTSLNTFGNTGSWISGINAGLLPNISTGYQQVHNPTAPVHGGPHLGHGCFGAGARAVQIRVHRTHGRREHERNGHDRLNPRQRRECSGADCKPRAGFILCRSEYEFGSVSTQQDQRSQCSDASNSSGFQQAPCLTP